MALTRKIFLKSSGAVAILLQSKPFGKLVTESFQQITPVTGRNQFRKDETQIAKIHIPKHIASTPLNKLYNFIKNDIKGKVAIKIHTGKRKGTYELPVELVKDFQQCVPI